MRLLLDVYDYCEAVYDSVLYVSLKFTTHEDGS